MQSSRRQILMQPVKLLWEVIYIHFSKLELSSDKHCLKWDSMKCRPTNLLRAHSGTSTLFSSLRATQLEICTILSSLKTLSLATISQKITVQESKRHTKRVSRTHSGMVRVGHSKRPGKISSELTQQQFPPKCYTNLHKKQKGQAASNP